MSYIDQSEPCILAVAPPAPHNANRGPLRLDIPYAMASYSRPKLRRT
jgi:hypothetical protein